MELTGSMSKTHSPLLDNGQPIHDIGGGIWRLCLKEQHDSRLTTNLKRVVGHHPVPHKVPGRGLNLVLREELGVVARE